MIYYFFQFLSNILKIYLFNIFYILNLILFFLNIYIWLEKSVKLARHKEKRKKEKGHHFKRLRLSGSPGLILFHGGNKRRHWIT